MAIVALIDALRRDQALAGITVETPALARLFKDREAEVRIRIVNVSKTARRVLIAIPAQRGLATPEEERVVDLPTGSDASEVAWLWTAHRQVALSHRCVLSGSLPRHSGLWTVRKSQPIALELRVYPNLRRQEDLRALRQGHQAACTRCVR